MLQNFLDNMYNLKWTQEEYGNHEEIQSQPSVHLPLHPNTRPREFTNVFNKTSKEWSLYIQVRYFQRTEIGLTLWSGFSFHFRLFIMRSFKLYHKQFKISEPIIRHSSSKNRSPILKEYTYLLKAGFTSSNKTKYANLVTFPNSLCSIDSLLMGESLNFP